MDDEKDLAIIITFFPRYLQCQSSMPIAVLRLYRYTSLFYIPIRFILLNRIASLGHCLCSSSSSVISLCLSLSSCSSELSTSISIVNLLTSPLSDSTSYVNENHRNDQSISDEICPPL
ncbi:unnamed protein product [Rotaria socialis]|uniref:Uncharacterized protein n=1 Tax=Rotaria socialis TaxID=392032 RepID=A0A817YUQ1_9BILA|nr:unnamed protein product [Rotaria socialis]CAF4217269.1 unnamed protein product [Rotaria socialis]CAF4435812.1 unnamed protein product [Rotaria socialis]